MTDQFPPSLLALDDEALSEIMALSAPILLSQRGAFLQALAAELAVQPGDAAGAGSIFRVGSRLQKQFLRHPDAVEARGPTRRQFERRG